MGQEIKLTPTLRERAFRYVSSRYDLSVGELIGGGRQKYFVEARALFVWIIRTRRESLSYPIIGRWLGDRDHSTIIHLHRKAIGLRLRNAEFKAMCDDFIRLCEQGDVIARAGLIDDDIELINLQIENLTQLRQALQKRSNDSKLEAA